MFVTVSHVGRDTGVRVICGGACGAVILPAEDVVLFLCPDEPDRNHYCFTCPRCKTVTVRPAAESAIAVLHSLGCPIKYVDIPGEWREHDAGKFDGLEAINEDDLIDFMAAIDKYNRTGAWA